MKFVFSALFALSLLWQANASASIDISQGSVQITGKQEFVINNMRMDGVRQPVWGRFEWDERTKSFSLTDFGPIAPNPVGRWDLSFDIGCDGAPGKTTWDVRRDGTGMSGEGRRFEWRMEGSDRFRLVYTTGGGTIYQGRFEGPFLRGTFSSPDGSTRGCWNAVKLERYRDGFLQNKVDPTNRRDSSGAR